MKPCYLTSPSVRPQPMRKPKKDPIMRRILFAQAAEAKAAKIAHKNAQRAMALAPKEK